MTLFALTKTQESGGQIALAAALAIVGFFLVLPRPRRRFVAAGTAGLIASAAVFGAWVYKSFGDPMPDEIGSVLFWLFSAGALIFGTVLVVQRNPARGAIAFAFVILSTCGLFLLLAAPFLMAATIIIYAGAIIVTFLFVLMLSHAEGPSDENDRSREPLYGSFAGFAFAGLVLFTLFQTTQTNANLAELSRKKAVSPLPVPVITAEERKTLADVIAKLDETDAQLEGDLSTADERRKRIEYFEKIDNQLAEVVGRSKASDTKTGSLRERLEKEAAKPARPGQPAEPAVLYRDDPQAREALERARRIREANFASVLENTFLDSKPDTAAVKAQAHKLRDEVVLLYGTGDLPADNVRNLGLVLYSEHLLAIELAGTLLLVAVIGAIAVAHRKGVAK